MFTVLFSSRNFKGLIMVVAMVAITWSGFTQSQSDDPQSDSSSANGTLPTNCIQDPARRSVCPRLIYKSAELPHPETRQIETRLVCVCLADFDDLLVPASSEVGKKVKELRIKSLTAQLQLTEQQLLDLIKY